MGSLLFDSRSGRFLIGFLGRDFGFLLIQFLLFLLNYFVDGFAGVGDLACFYIVAFVAKALIKHFYFSKSGDAVGSLLRRFGLSRVLHWRIDVGHPKAHYLSSL